MQFSAVYGMVLAFALGVAAHGAPSVHQDKTQCPGAQVSCCINKSDIKGEGVLDNLLARGLISNLIGASDQACAKTELIGEINILGEYLISKDNGVMKNTALLTWIINRYLQRRRWQPQVRRPDCLLPRWRKGKICTLFPR